jgi:hypothetical protein
MPIFPTLSQEQLRELASMSPKDLLAAADEHEGEARWQQLQANALRELANDGRPSKTAVAKRTPSRRSRRASRKSSGSTGPAPRFPDGLTREQLPKFAVRRAEDPTGQKELMLGVMWITRDLTWSAPEITDELERTGLLKLKSHMGITFLSRMAASDPPWVVKHGQGRDTRYQISPDVRPIEGAAGAANPAPQDGDRA